jgi:hypothetical protein
MQRKRSRKRRLICFLKSREYNLPSYFSILVSILVTELMPMRYVSVLPPDSLKLMEHRNQLQALHVDMVGILDVLKTQVSRW